MLVFAAFMLTWAITRPLSQGARPSEAARFSRERSQLLEPSLDLIAPDEG